MKAEIIENVNFSSLSFGLKEGIKHLIVKEKGAKPTCIRN